MNIICKKYGDDPNRMAIEENVNIVDVSLSGFNAGIQHVLRLLKVLTDFNNSPQMLNNFIVFKNVRYFTLSL